MGPSAYGEARARHGRGLCASPNLTREEETVSEPYPVDPNLESHNSRGYRGINAPAATMDLPVQSYIIPDETTERLVRLEAKVDAIGAQLQWVVSTVTAVVDNLKSSPLMSMMSKKMGQ